MSDAHKKHRLISPRMVAGLLLGCALLAWLFMPTKRDLLERQVRDGFSQKALATLESLSPRERAKAPAYYALAELQVRRELLNPKNANAVRQQLLAACVAAAQFNYEPEFTKEILAVLPLVESAAELREWLQPFLGKMPAAMQRAIFDSLVAKALAASQPELAAQIFAEFWTTAPSDASTAAEMVRLWRLAGKPASALAAIEAFAQQSGGNLARTAPTLTRLRVDLLRETGEAGQAFKAAWELAEASGPAEREKLFEVLVATARESGQGAQILAEVRRRAEAAPNDENAWRLLAELALGASRPAEALAAAQQLVKLRPTDRAAVMRAAQIAEWSGRSDVAFDLYLQALKLKEPAALERLLALNPGLYRDADLSAALAGARGLVDLQQHGLFLARLHVGVGSYDEARADYETMLRSPGADLAMFKEYGRLLLDLQDYERATGVFQHAEKLAPRDLPTQRALAEVSFRLGHFEAAMLRYQRLLTLAMDAETLENFIAIADSLGRVPEIIVALQQSIAHSTNGTAQAFHRLAHYQGMLGQTVAMGRTLREGLTRFPQDHALRLQLVYELVQEQRLGDALTLLASHPELRSNADLAALNLDLLTQAGRKNEAEQFLVSGLAASVLESSAVRTIVKRMRQVVVTTTEAGGPPTVTVAESVDVARRYREYPNDSTNAAEYVKLLLDSGRIKEAEMVLRPFLAQPTAPVMQAAALLYSSLGNFRRAEFFQRRYLETAPPDRARALAYLGDILSARGDKTGARIWYQRSLNEFWRTFATQPRS